MKQIQQDRAHPYTLGTRIFLGLTTTLATANFLIWYSGLCESEERAVFSGHYAVLGAALCPLFTAAAGLLVLSKTSVSKVGDDCIGVIDGRNQRPYQDHLMYLAQTPEDVKDAKKHQGHILDKFSEFNNTIFHFEIMNHYYTRVRKIFPALTEEEQTVSCLAQDKNGRTPLFLSMAISAPADIQDLFMNKESVLVVDNEGVSPLNLASMGLTSLDMTKKILSLMDDKDLIGAWEVISASDPLSSKQIAAHFERYEINPKKASNHCTDNISDEPYCMHEESYHKYWEKYDIGKGRHGNKYRYCFLATRKNVEFFANDFKDPEKIDFVKEAQRLLPDISDQSITDATFMQQRENRAFIEKAVEQRKQAQKRTMKLGT